MATKEQVVADRTFATERYILSTMPVLYLPLWKTDSGESGDSLISSDGHGFSCTVSGALWTSKGRLFDATDDVIVVPQSTSINITGKITIEEWCYLTGWGEGDFGYLFNKGTFFAHTLKGSAIEGIRFRVATSAGNKQADTTDGSIVLNKWTHIVCVYDKVAVRAYIDGTVTNGSADTNDIDDNSAFDLRIGNDTGTTGTFDGTIGEVRIYNRALSAVEVQSNYIATKWRYQ